MVVKKRARKNLVVLWLSSSCEGVRAGEKGKGQDR